MSSEATTETSIVSSRGGLRHRRLTLGMLLLSIYLGIAPVSRLPGLDDTGLYYMKWTLATSAAVLVLMQPLLGTGLRIPGRWLGPVGFAGLILLSLPGLIQARDLFVVGLFLADVGYAAVLLWCFYSLARQGEDLKGVFIVSFLIIAAFAAVQLAVVVASIPDWTSSCEWGTRNAFTFASHRMTWSSGLALFLPMCALLGATAFQKHRNIGVLVSVITAGAVIGGQFVSGGRAGLLASAISIALLISLRGTRLLACIIFISCVLVAAALFDESCRKHLRLDRLSPVVTAADFSNVDHLSTSRISGYKAALAKIAERPLLGHGLGQVKVEGAHKANAQIHNLWLKWAAYCGILAPLFFAVMVFIVLRRAWALLRQGDKEDEQRITVAALLLVLLSGLFLTMLQPSALLGSFQYTAIWWAAAGSIVGMHWRIYGGSEWLIRLRDFSIRTVRV